MPTKAIVKRLRGLSDACRLGVKILKNGIAVEPVRDLDWTASRTVAPSNVVAQEGARLFAGENPTGINQPRAGGNVPDDFRPAG